MKKISKHIPNFITCLNLLCGSIACQYALNGDAYTVFILLVFAAVFDFCDGMASRLLNAYSAVGKELDSLADMVSFALVPGLLIFALLKQMAGDGSPDFISRYLPYIAFLLPIFSGLRLAKFNVDERQTTTFIGLPTPANALFWVSISVVLIEYGADRLNDQFIVAGLSPALVSLIASHLNIWILAVLVIFFSWVMVADVPMFSFKMSKFSWSTYKMIYLFVIMCILLIVGMGVLGLCASIVIYIIFSFIRKEQANQASR